MNRTALENQKNTIEYYIDELNKIYKSIDYEEVFKFTYEKEQYINEEFLDTHLLDLMKVTIFLINDYSKKLAFNSGNTGMSHHLDIDDSDFEQYQEQEKNMKIIYNNQLEVFWNQIPHILKEIYVLTHVSQKGIDKKERYTRFIRSIYILTNSDKKLSIHYFINNLDLGKLFLETERFVLDRNNIDENNHKDSKSLLFYFTKDDETEMIEHLQTHIFLLYYHKYLGVSKNKTPDIFEKVRSKNSERKKYFARIKNALFFLENKKH